MSNMESLRNVLNHNVVVLVFAVDLQCGPNCPLPTSQYYLRRATLVGKGTDYSFLLAWSVRRKAIE